MEYPTSQSGRITLIHVNGELAALESTYLAMQLEKLLKSRAIFLVVDLDNVHFMSSAGIRALLSSAKTAYAMAGELVLADVQPDVLRVLEMGGVLPLVRAFGSTGEAIQALAG